jgi:ArsR family metal-binding transcriptional regulator
MLLQAYKITRILPCIADPEKIRVIADVSGEIHEAFPYLNATLKGCIYNHQALTLTLKQGDKLITLHARHITLAKIEDEKEAEEMLKWLQNLVNETYRNRDSIEPNYSMSRELKPTDIYKLLPATNCKECGQASCFAFAFKLVRKETEIKKCSPLFSGKFAEKREVLFEILHNAGYELPDADLNSQRVEEVK